MYVRYGCIEQIWIEIRLLDFFFFVFFLGSGWVGGWGEGGCIKK